MLGYFDGKIEAVIDGGPAASARESTLIDMSRKPYPHPAPGRAFGEKAIADALAENLTLVGITGGSGCGKTTALRELGNMGALVLDCDAIYHELLATDRDMIAELYAPFPARSGRRA